MVERFVRGNEHRLLVVGGKVVAAARGEAAWVTGDGVSSVSMLVNAQLNTDPRRGLAETCPLGLIETDTDAAIILDLERQGLHPHAVPAVGRAVLIQRNGNVAIDCTDEVHPEVAHVVSLAARIVGLDIAGIDVVAQDISRPLQSQGGAIVEVNAGPGLLMHLKPAAGAPRPVGQAICAHLFPDVADYNGGETVPTQPSGRIPLVGVAGSQGSAGIARLIAWLLHLSGRPTGLACEAGLFLDQRCIDPLPSAHWEAGQRLLINRAVQAAVFENSAGSILRDGLAYDRCQIGVVTDLLGSETLAGFDIDGPEHMFRVLRAQVDAVLPFGAAVLHAEAGLLDMVPLCDGEVLFYSADPDAASMASHRQDGGRALTIRQDRIVLATGASEVFLPGLASVSVWRKRHSRSAFSDAMLLAATGAAWALGIPLNLIGAGLEAFAPNDKPTAGATR